MFFVKKMLCLVAGWRGQVVEDAVVPAPVKAQLRAEVAALSKALLAVQKGAAAGNKRKAIAEAVAAAGAASAEGAKFVALRVDVSPGRRPECRLSSRLLLSCGSRAMTVSVVPAAHRWARTLRRCKKHPPRPRRSTPSFLSSYSAATRVRHSDQKPGRACWPGSFPHLIWRPSQPHARGRSE